MGDCYARKKNAAKKEAAKEAPSCLVRAVTRGKGSKKRRIATVVDLDSCDLFRKRVGHLFKIHLLKSKSKIRSASQ